MIRYTNISQTAVINKTVSLEGKFFNSKHHLLECLHKELGYSINTLKKILNPIFKEGSLVFKEHYDGLYLCYQLLYTKNSLSYEKQAIIPQYILDTRKINDGTRKLGEREYRILCYLNELRSQVAYYNEENETNSPLYPCLETISKAVDCSYCQAAYSMHKIEYYFSNFWVNADDFESRVHTKSHSLTINLPPRKEWKALIQAKVLETTGLDKLNKENVDYADEELFEKLKQMRKRGYEKCLKTYIEIDCHFEEELLQPSTEEEWNYLDEKNQTKKIIRAMHDKVLCITNDLVERREISEIIQARELKPFKRYEVNSETIKELSLALELFTETYKPFYNKDHSGEESSFKRLYDFRQKLYKFRSHFEEQCYLRDIEDLENSIKIETNNEYFEEQSKKIEQLKKKIKPKNQQLRERGILTSVKEIRTITQIDIDLNDAPFVNEDKVNDLIKMIEYQDGVYRDIAKTLAISGDKTLL